MKKILPVNRNPYIRAYTEYAYPNAIMSSVFHIGKTLLHCKTSEDIGKEWNWDKNSGHYIIEKNSFSYEEDYLEQPKVKHIYRKMKDKDEFTIQINYQQYTNMWDYVGLFIDYEDKVADSGNEHIALIGNYCGSMFLVSEGESEQDIFLEHDRKDYPIYMRIIKNNMEVEFSYSLDGKEWTLAKVYNLKEENRQYVLGIQISLLARQYYKWVFNNFINLRFDLDEGSDMNYCNLMKRDSKNYTISPIIRFEFENLDIVEKYGLSVWDFIVYNIQGDRYIEFWLNERYIPGLEAYQKSDFTHESMVYGFEDFGEKQLYVMSILGGKTISYKLKYSDFIKAFNARKMRRGYYCYMFEYKPDNVQYELDIDGIVSQLKDYCCGTNSTSLYKHLIGEETGVFGIKCYDAFLNDDASMKKLLSDVRVSYVLLEHKKCMRDRIEYLVSPNFLVREKNQDIIQSSQEIYRIAEIIMNLVIKYIIAPKNSIIDKLIRRLQELRDEELECYKKLYERLSMHSRDTTPGSHYEKRHTYW